MIFSCTDNKYECHSEAASCIVDDHGNLNVAINNYKFTSIYQCLHIEYTKTEPGCHPFKELPIEDVVIGDNRCDKSVIISPYVNSIRKSLVLWVRDWFKESGSYILVLFLLWRNIVFRLQVITWIQNTEYWHLFALPKLYAKAGHPKKVFSYRQSPFYGFKKIK